MGIERLIQMYEKTHGENSIQPKQMDLFIATIGEEANEFATSLTEQLRQEKIYVEKDIAGRSLKAQMKYADKQNARYSMTIGETEVETKKAKLKEMKTGEEREVILDAKEIQELVLK